MAETASRLYLPPNVIRQREGQPLNPYPVSVLFVLPGDGDTLGFNKMIKLPYHGTEVVAGGITGWARDIAIHDERFIPNGLETAMNTHKPDIVALPSTFLTDIPTIKKLAAQIKAIAGLRGKEVTIVVGGHEATVYPQALLDDPNIDVIVHGAGEGPMRKIVETKAKGRSFDDITDTYTRKEDGRLTPNKMSSDEDTKQQKYCPNSTVLDEKPEARRDLTEAYKDMGDGTYFVDYSNPDVYYDASGCVRECHFCTVHKSTGGIYMIGSPEKTIEKITNLARGRLLLNLADLAYYDIATTEAVADGLLRAGVKNDFFYQTRVDAISSNNERLRARQLAVLQKLAQVGRHIVFLGIESLNPAELDEDGKGTDPEMILRAVQTLKDIKVNDERRFLVMAAFMARLDWGQKNFDRLIKDIRLIAPDYLQLTVLTPQPGSDDWVEAEAANQIETRDWRLYDFEHAVAKTKLPRKDYYDQFTRVAPESMPINEMLNDLKTRERARLVPRGTLRRLGGALRQSGDPNSYMEGHRKSEESKIVTPNGIIYQY